MSFGNSVTSAQCRNQLHTLCADKRCACRCHNPDQGDLFEMSRSSGQMNAVGSPTGRVTRDAPATSVDAAVKTDAKTLRQKVYGLVVMATEGGVGMTSIEVAEAIPRIKVSNRAASRLGELWEMRLVAVQRERGTCNLGTCHPHDKAQGIIHKPLAKCVIHGAPRVRDGASVWVAL